VKLLSIGFFVSPDTATLWRGGMATSALKQLIADADWGELDYFVLDTPPGTSDIHLTLLQTLPITGAVIVSTPQAVALADARKGIDMYRNEKVNVPILGLVENMAWFTPAELPDNRYYIFGREGGKQLAEEMGVPLLAQIPSAEHLRERRRRHPRRPVERYGHRPVVHQPGAGRGHRRQPPQPRAAPHPHRRSEIKNPARSERDFLVLGSGPEMKF
jgi:hypothetical protein